MISRRTILRSLFVVFASLIARPFRRLYAEDSDNPDTATVESDSLPSLSDSTTVEPDSLRTDPRTLAEISLKDIPDLASIGKSARIEINDEEILLIRDTENSIRAVSAACTHKHVKVKYDEKRDQIRCPAHGSRFALSGEVIKGPAEVPLTSYDARLVGDRIIIYAPESE